MRAPSPYAETDVNSVDLGAFDDSNNENGDSEQPSLCSKDRYKEFIGEFVRGNNKFRGTVRLFINDKDGEELLNHGKGQKIKSRDKNNRICKDSNKVNNQPSIPLSSKEAPQMYYNIQPSTPLNIYINLHLPPNHH